jgi:hypothetical protein
MSQLADWTYHLYHGFRHRPHNVRLRLRGLRDPSSRSGAVHILKNLKHHGYQVDPENLRLWATEHGWRTSDAEDPKAYAQDVFSGRRYHTDPSPFRQSDIDRWREGAGKVSF